MYNEQITSVPVMLFLGAGASNAFGKMMMGEFVDYLNRRDGFKDDPLFHDIVSVPEGRDLEHLFQELDEWSRKAYKLQEDTTSIRKRGSPSSSGESIMQRLAGEASRLLENLRKEVFNAYRDIQPQHSKELVRHFGVLFEVLIRRIDLAKNPLVVFTTNYDPAIETFCQAEAGEYRLCDGFIAQGNAGSPVWHRESIDNLRLGADSRKDVVLFKLHGSTSWFKAGLGVIKSDARIYVGADTSFANLLIYPAKRKVALDDPYFTAYDYFQRTLEKCKVCVAIGYSFRDYDALSRLRSAASYNPSLRVLVMDPKADLISKLLKGYGVHAEPLPQSFGWGTDYLAAMGAALSTLS